MKKPSLGSQETELLKFISACREPLTVREITEAFGEKYGLARTTILTMLERLRKKGFVNRTEIEGINHYASNSSKSDLLQEMVSHFVEKTLEGSLSPFVTYLTQKAELSDAELAEFKQLIANLEQNRSTKK
jgi:predicted transcriptional regulator